MKTRFIYIIVILTFIPIMQSFGQKLVKLPSGDLVIDCSDMPVYSITKTPKPTTTKYTDSYVPPGSDINSNLSDLGSLKSDERVYVRFAVQKDANAGKLKYADAVSACNAKNDKAANITGWRLPTFRELMLIQVFHPTLVELGMAELYRYTDANSPATLSATISPLVTYSGKGAVKLIIPGGYKVDGRHIEFYYRCIQELPF